MLLGEGGPLATKARVGKTVFDVFSTKAYTKVFFFLKQTSFPTNEELTHPVVLIFAVFFYYFRNIPS